MSNRVYSLYLNKTFSATVAFLFTLTSISWAAPINDNTLRAMSADVGVTAGAIRTVLETGSVLKSTSASISFTKDAIDFSQQTVKDYEAAYRDCLIRLSEVGTASGDRIFPVFKDKGFSHVAMKVPDAPDGGIVVEIESSYFCGTDLEMMRGNRPIDASSLGILGHEAVGRVIKAGKGVEGYKKGQRVLLSPIISDGICANCRKGVRHLCKKRTAHGHILPGFFAPYAVVLAQDIASGNVIPVSGRLPSKYSALSEPVACALYDLKTAKKSAEIRGRHSKLTVWGCGFQGIIHAILASSIDEVRYNRIVMFDNDIRRVYAARKVLDSLGLYHVEVYISTNEKECSNLKAEILEIDKVCADTDFTVMAYSPKGKRKDLERLYLSAAGRTRKGGVVSVYGGLKKFWGDISGKKVHSNEVTIIGNTGAPAATIIEAYRLIESGVLSQKMLDSLVTHEFSLQQLPQALKALDSGEALKVRIVCNEDFDYEKNSLSDLIEKARREGRPDIKVSMKIEGADSIMYVDSREPDAFKVLSTLGLASSLTQPTSDTDMNIHAACHVSNPDIKYIVQAEHPFIQGLISKSKTLTRVTPDEIALLGERHPIPLVSSPPHYNFLPEEIAREFRSHNAVLTRSNGVFACGATPLSAYHRNILVEDTAKTVVAAEVMGRAESISEEGADRLLGADFEIYRKRLQDGLETAVKLDTIKRDYDPIEIEALREALVNTGRKIAEQGLIVGPGGNISACTMDRKIMLIKAKGRSFENMTREQYVGVDIETGKVVEGLGTLPPSTEAKFHLAIYKARKDVYAVIHTHPPFLTGVATAGAEFSLGGKTTVSHLPYIHPGGDELASAVSEGVKENDLLLMANHGIIAVGKGFNQALDQALELSILAEKRAEAIVMNKRAFKERLAECLRLQNEELPKIMKSLQTSSNDKTMVKWFLAAGNAVNFAREGLLLESKRTKVRSIKGVKEGDILWNVVTKEVLEFSKSGKKRVEKDLTDFVILTPLTLSGEHRRHRDELIKMLDDGLLEKREAAVIRLKAMEQRGILDAPFKTRDVSQHCRTTCSLGPYSPSHLAWRGYQLGLLATGKVDHDTLAGSQEFREAARTLGLRNPMTGHEQRANLKGTPYEGKETNSPGNNNETYFAVYGVFRDEDEMLSDRVRPAKIERFKKTIVHLNSLDLGGQRLNLDYENDVRPLTQYNNPTEKHLAKAMALRIYDIFAEGIDRGNWTPAVEFTQTLINECGPGPKGNIKLGKEHMRIIEGLDSFIIFIQSRVLEEARKVEGLQPGDDEVVNVKEIIRHAHSKGYKVFYRYRGWTDPCWAERPENIRGFFTYLKSIGVDGIAFAPNRNLPKEIDKVRSLAAGEGLQTIINGADVYKNGIPLSYFDYSCHEDFTKAALSLARYEKRKRAGQEYDPSSGDRLEKAYRAAYEEFMVPVEDAGKYGDAIVFPVVDAEKALSERGDEGKKGNPLEFKQIAMRRLRAPEGGVVVELKACYICGTDVAHFNRKRPLNPNTLGILGHEAVGVIKEVGKGVTGYKVGDHVLLNTMMADMTCDTCQKGLFHMCKQRRARSHQYPGFLYRDAIFFKKDIETGNLIKISGKVDERYSALCESMGCALYDMMYSESMVKGQANKIVIVGSGFQGIIHAAMAALVDEVRYHEIILLGRNEAKNKAARELFEFLGLSQIKVYNNKELSQREIDEVCDGADVTIVAFSPRLEEPEERKAAEKIYLQAANRTREGGVVSLFGGVPEDWGVVSSAESHYREITFVGNSGAPTEVLARVHELMEKGKLPRELLDPLVTHEFTLAEVDKALEAASGKDSLKVMVRCDDTKKGYGGKQSEYLVCGGKQVHAEYFVKEDKSKKGMLEDSFYLMVNLFMGYGQIAKIKLEINKDAIVLGDCEDFHFEPGQEKEGIDFDARSRIFSWALLKAYLEAGRKGLTPRWAIASYLLGMHANGHEHEDYIRLLAGKEFIQYDFGLAGQKLPDDPALRQILDKFSTGSYPYNRPVYYKSLTSELGEHAAAVKPRSASAVLRGSGAGIKGIDSAV